MFRRKKNTFLLEVLSPEPDSVLGEGEDHYERTFRPELTRNLSTVSALYIYTGTPPMGYGSQAPKVATTVNRAEEYNRKKVNRYIQVGDLEVSRLNWEEKDGAFPHDKVHGNYLTSAVKEACSRFLISNHVQIDASISHIVQEVATASSDVLTRGRQTFCPFLEQSVPAAQAYENAFNFLEENGFENIFSLTGWMKAIVECFDRDSITILETQEVDQHFTMYDPITKQKKPGLRKKQVRKKVIIQGNANVRERMRQLCCRFASYIKHKERGKKDRRAIASATMFLRPFLYVIEEFALKLSETLSGSTISIGGEQKKAKITNNLEDDNLGGKSASHICQGTEDATKWNECLSPGIFALMHHYFFDKMLRAKLGIPPPGEYGTFFSNVAEIGHLFQAWKEIQIGPGVMVQNDKHYSRLTWSDDCMKMMNAQTLEWYNSMRERISPCRKYVRASPGMLMGMLNAASTIVGLLPENFRMDRKTMRTICMRSSDDSTTKYLADSDTHMKACVVRNKQNLSLFGINLSPDKTFFFVEGFGEYTSWYMEGKFVSQYGTDIPSIRPQGKNPSDDLYFIAKSTSVAQQTLNINPLGAAARLRFGISATKRLWRLPDMGKNPRANISLEVQVIEDGGLNLWNCMNCHLNQYAHKMKHIETQEERDYLLRIMNPNNPFTEGVDEEMTYSKEYGKLILETIESPRNIFNYVKRSNRTFKGDLKKEQAEKEISHAAVYELLVLSDPTITLQFPTSSCNMADHVISILEMKRDAGELSQDEEMEYQRALGVLKTGVVPGHEERIVFEELDED